MQEHSRALLFGALLSSDHGVFDPIRFVLQLLPLQQQEATRFWAFLCIPNEDVSTRCSSWPAGNGAVQPLLGWRNSSLGILPFWAGSCFP